METAVKHGIKQGKNITAEQMETIRQEDGESYAFQSALKYVARKPRTQKEIEKKLREKEVDEWGIRYAISKLKEYGYINDGEYAEIYAQELAQKYGGRVIEAKLVEKGIDRDVARQLAEEADNGVVLREMLGRLQIKHQDGDVYKNRQKIVRALLGRGFSYDEIKQAMNGEMDEA